MAWPRLELEATEGVFNRVGVGCDIGGSVGGPCACQRLSDPIAETNLATVL